MQTPKARANSGTGAAPRTSPRAVNSPRSASSDTPEKVSPRVVRQLKANPRYSEPTASSSSIATRGSKERSPKVASEKKQNGKVDELESQISLLENDLKVVKDQLSTTEQLKKQAEEEAEESKQKLLALSLKLDESQRQLLEKSTSGDVSEITEIPAVSEVEPVQPQHSHDSSTLASALDEIQKLKAQLDMVSDSESTDLKNSEAERTELQQVKDNLSETLVLVEEMRNQLRETKESELHAHQVARETLAQLEEAKKIVETLKSDGLKSSEAYNTVVSELDQSTTRVGFLEELVKKLEAEKSCDANNEDKSEHEKMEIEAVKVEVEQLRSALEAAEIRYNEERIRSTEQARNAVEMVDKIKAESDQREAMLEMELQKSKDEIDELKANLMDKETELQGICEENEALAMKLEKAFIGPKELELEKELHKLKSDAENMRALLLEKESLFKNASDENQKLKLEIENTRKNFEESNETEPVETEVLMNLSHLTEEVDESNKRAIRVAEQLEAAQASNAEMEAELRRLKVQSDQWRKAAEAAAAMITAGTNGQVMERTGSMDSHFSPRIGKIGSPYMDELEDELMKKKNPNMLTRLWKKPQK